MLRSLVVVACTVVAGWATIHSTESRTASTHTLCVVSDVTDGDSFRCADGTEVHLAQVDAPEIDACGGAWAKAALEFIFLRPGTAVTLAGETLTREGSHRAAPLILGTDGQAYDISVVMVYVGLARPAFVGPRSARIDLLVAAETWARTARWNMWAPGGPFNGGTSCGT